MQTMVWCATALRMSPRPTTSNDSWQPSVAGLLAKAARKFSLVSYRGAWLAQV